MDSDERARYSKRMVALIQSIALDIAGLGLLGAGAYSLITGTGGTDAATALIGLGGGYLGYKVAASTSTVVQTPTAVKDSPVVVAAPVKVV